MNSLRWTITLLATAAIGAAVLRASHTPAGDRPTPTAPQSVRALPLPLPDTPPIRAAKTALTAASAPAAAAARATTGPRVGSEGYGAHIDLAMASNDPQAAWEAVGWMTQCQGNDATRGSLEAARGQGLQPALMTLLMAQEQAEARRCQTITAQHHAQRTALTARAMHAGLPAAAAAYANQVQPDTLSTAERDTVARAIRRDAQSGDAQSLLAAALVTDHAWHLGLSERLGFFLAYCMLLDMPEPAQRAHCDALVKSGQLGLKAAPTPQQLAEAAQAAQLIVAQSRARAR